jgi:hypothetical protein
MKRIRKKRFGFIEKTLIGVIFFIILIFIFPKNIINVDVADLFTATTVLFGVIAGFFIAATLTNYFRLQTLMAEETTNLISICNYLFVLKPNLEKEMHEAIDKYLIATFDYELEHCIDYTEKEFENIISITKKVPPRDTDVYSNFLNAIENLYKTRQEIRLSSRRIMGIEHWITLGILAAMVISLLYIMKTDSVLSSIFVVLLSSVTLLVLFLLEEIDSEIFAEDKLAFLIYEPVFKRIGKLPYYPEVSIKSGRVKISGLNGQKYRIGIYTDYPKSLNKKIIVSNIK